MPHSPLGGLSFLVNLFIAVVGSGVRLVARRSHFFGSAATHTGALFTGQRYDSLFRRSLARSIPVAVLATMMILLVSATSFGVLIGHILASLRLEWL